MNVNSNFQWYNLTFFAGFTLLSVILNGKLPAYVLLADNIGRNELSINHAPAFGNNNYNNSISEESVLGMTVATISATDSDGDQLTYTIKSGNTNKALKINSSTGAISLTKRLNYHTQSVYTIILKVTDEDGLSDEASLVIMVIAKAVSPGFIGITWNTVKNQPYGTHEIHGEVVNGKLYIFGGFDVLKRPNYTPTKRAFVYDPSANTWTPIADLPHNPKGTNFGGITNEGLTNDGTDIYFAAGFTSNTSGGGQIFGSREVWKYNVSSNTYSALPDLPLELAAGQLRYLKGRIHYMGGANKLRQDVNVHYALNLDSLSAGWKTLSPLPNARNRAGSTVYNGKIYFIGGSHFKNEDAVAQNTVSVYDPNTNSWTKAADLPVARYHIASSVVVLGSRIFVLGGETSFGNKCNLVSAYSPASNTWENLTPLPVIKAAGIAGVLNGNLYYTGGNFSNINYKGAPVISANNLKLDSFTLINADTDQPLQTLSNGNTINPGTLSTTQFNIRAQTNPANIGSVLFSLSGPQNKNVTDNQFPYTLFGDDGEGDYYPWAPAAGQYTLKATPYSGSGGTGTSGTSKTITFNVVKDAAQKTTLLPVADAFVRDGTYAGINYGNSSTLEAKTFTSSGVNRRSYLKFSINTISSVSSAILRIYGSNTSDATTINIAAYAVNIDSWTETGIKFSNAPASVSLPLSSTAVKNLPGYYEFDVTPFVKAQLAGDKIVSLLVKDPNNSDKRLIFNSRENTKNVPQLIIYSAGQSNWFVKKSINGSNDEVFKGKSFQRF